MTERPDYGIDAPYVVRNLVLVAAGCLVLASFAPLRIARASGITALLCGGESAYMIWSSRVGKIKQRDELLESVNWRGEEQVLDIGCGRGLLLVGVAKRLRSAGIAVGID